jgi:Ca2+-binding RTX toxin-like protein
MPLTTFSIDPLVTTSAEQLVALAGGSEAIAHRYALKELNPFAVVGETARTAFYDRFNINGALVSYDSVNRTGELTTEWTADRAAFQAWKNLANVNNTQVQLSAQGNQSVRFTDLPQKYTLPVVPVGAGSPVAQLTRQFIFGGDRSDVLAGNARSDRLYGGAAGDFLTGRGDSDYLEGGKGLDVYQYHGAASILGEVNDGHDVVRDIDGKGVLRYTYSPLLGSAETTIVSDASDKRSDTEWRSANGKYIYTKTGADLVVTFSGGTGGSITLRDFRDGDLGIHLRNARADPQNATRTFYGDKEDFDSDPSTGGVQPVADGFGNNQRADGVGPHPDIDSANREDLFHGSASEGEVELFRLGGGNDQALADGNQLYPATGGVAWMQGGDGRDMLHGGPADDLLEGGADGVLLGEIGGDTAFGGFGNDEIYGGATRPASTACSSCSSRADARCRTR